MSKISYFTHYPKCEAYNLQYNFESPDTPVIRAPLLFGHFEDIDFYSPDDENITYIQFKTNIVLSEQAKLFALTFARELPMNQN